MTCDKNSLEDMQCTEYFKESVGFLLGECAFELVLAYLPARQSWQLKRTYVNAVVAFCALSYETLCAKNINQKAVFHMRRKAL